MIAQSITLDGPDDLISGFNTGQRTYLHFVNRLARDQHWLDPDRVLDHAIDPVPEPFGSSLICKCSKLQIIAYGFDRGCLHPWRIQSPRQGSRWTQPRSCSGFPVQRLTGGHAYGDSGWVLSPRSPGL